MDNELINVLKKVIKDEIKPIKDEIKTINYKLETVLEQTAGLSEFRTEVTGKLDKLTKEVKELRTDVNNANKEIARNRVDIEVLKKALC